MNRKRPPSTYKESKEDKILSSILDMIKSNPITKENITDILIITKGALAAKNNNIILIINIIQAIMKQLHWNDKINSLLFINIFNLYKYIQDYAENKDENIRRLLLLIEYYLMLDLDIIREEQIEMILFIMKEFLTHNSTQISFKYGFIYLKLIEILNRRNKTTMLKNSLLDIKILILDTLPENKEGQKLKSLLIQKTI